MNRMTEDDFIRSIDCKFPFQKNKWKPLVDAALSISEECVLMCIYEVCVLPRSKFKIKITSRLKIIDYISFRGESELIKLGCEIGRTIILEKDQSLNEIENFKNAQSRSVIILSLLDYLSENQRISNP